MNNKTVGSETRSVNDEIIGDPNPSNEQYYAITIKPTFNSYKKKVMVNPQLLLEKFQMICKDKGHKLVSYSLEYDSKGIYHLHGIFSTENPFQAFNCCEKGWHIYVSFCYDSSSWTEYINKDKPHDHEFMFV